MGKDKGIEKKFAENIDRILAGEDIKADPSLNAEMRADLEFVKKVRSLGEAPSAQFQARLKASLLQKLEAQQARQRDEQGLWRIFRQPAWQGGIAVLLAIIALAIVWRSGFFQPSVSAPVTTTVTPSTTKAATTTAAAAVPKLVSIDAKTDKSTYRAGETVKINISMKNVSGQPLTLTDFPPIMSLMQADTNQPAYTFQAGKAVVSLAPDQAAAYTYTWNETDFNGQQVSGSYYVELEDLEYNGQAYELNLNQPVKFEVLR
jgi:hypothetical protein